MELIPKTLILFWHDKNHIPDRLQHALEITKSTHEGFDVILADDAYMHEVLDREFPQLAEVYRQIQIPAARSDVARFVLLYLYGGVYLDISMAFHRPFTELFDFTEDLVFVRRNDLPQYKNNPKAAHFLNGIIAAAPRSDFIGKCLNRLFFNLATGVHNRLVFTSTGAMVLNEMFMDISQDLKVTELLYSDLPKAYFKSMRVEGVNNSWTAEEKDGIINPAYYERTLVPDRPWRSFCLDLTQTAAKQNKTWFGAASILGKVFSR